MGVVGRWAPLVGGFVASACIVWNSVVLGRAVPQHFFKFRVRAKWSTNGYRNAFRGQQYISIAIDDSRVGQKNVLPASVAIPSGMAAACPPQVDQLGLQHAFAYPTEWGVRSRGRPAPPTLIFCKSNCRGLRDQVRHAPFTKDVPGF